MPAPQNQPFYDITPLQAWLEGDAVILTPNFRLARRVLQAWGQFQVNEGKRLWHTPTVLSLDAWQSRLWDELTVRQPQLAARRLTEPMVQALWQQLIEADGAQASMLQPRGAAQLAAEAHRNLLLWQIDTADPLLRQQFHFTEDGRQFLRWRAQYQRRCDELGVADSAQCIQNMLPFAAELPKQQIVLLEFDAIAPLSECLLQAVCDDVVWHRAAARAGGRRQLAVFPDPRSELHAAAAWARRCYERHPDHTIGVLVPDLGQRRPALERALLQQFELSDAQQLPVNFSAGSALAQTPPVQAALELLALGLPQQDTEQVVQLVQTRFSGGGDGVERREQLIASLYRFGRRQLRGDQLRSLALHAAADRDPQAAGGSIFGQRLLQLSQRRELRGKHLPSAWVPLLQSVLELWQWPGRKLNSREYQQVEHWQQTLEQLRGFDEVCGALAYGPMLQLLQNLCRANVFQAQSADSTIQVLGLLEGAGLRFDHLWICGMQASRWPEAARPNPFIPVPLQRERGLPHADAARELQFARGLMAQFQAASTDLIASMAATDGGVAEAVSSLVRDFERVDEHRFSVDARPPWVQNVTPVALEQLLDAQAPALTAVELQQLRGGSGIISDQSACPFRSFVRQRLRVRGFEAFQLVLTPAQRGTVLHHALAYVWQELQDSETLQNLSEAQQRELLGAAASAAIGSLPTRTVASLDRAYLDVEAVRLENLLQQWLQLERGRGPFRVIAQEQQVQLQLGDLTLDLRIDRVDELPGGERLIVDYKSGRCSVGQWLGERPEQPQMPLYALAMQRADAIAFAQVRDRECAFVGAGAVAVAPGVRTDIDKLAKGEAPVPDDWPGLLQWWQQQLTQLADDFVAGHASVDPATNRSCDYCDLASVCRIAEGRS